jgi:hypothetical protein
MTVDAPKIFFSYARADTQFVLELANELRSAGVNLWIDQLDIVPGERWDNAVQNALATAPCLLVVLSPESVASQSVMDEVAFALQSNKRVVPVLYQRCDIPFRIQRLQYIDFTTSYDEGFSQLIRALKPLQPSLTTEASVQAKHQDESAPEVARTERETRVRLMYLLGAGLLAAVIGISYWVYSGRRAGEAEITPTGTRLGRAGDESLTVGWSFRVLNIAEADVYAERHYQEKKTIRPQGPGDVLIIIDARLKNVLEVTQSPVLTERQPGNTGLIDDQGHSYQPLDYDARQERDKTMSYAGAALLPGAVADFALVFSVPKGTRPKSLVFTIKEYSEPKGTNLQVSLGR